MAEESARPRQCNVCGNRLAEDALRGLCATCLLSLGLTEEPQLHLRCPHCRNPIEVIGDLAVMEVTCPSCDSKISLVGEQTVVSPPTVAARLAHFELMEVVGEGAFGTVWKARDTALDRLVAIKLPRRDQLAPEETEQFLREARSAAQLRHPGIVNVHEVGRSDGHIYIVSEFLDGITLADWLTGQRPTAREAATWCAQLASALQHAHQQGVIHRDLKPSNVMLDNELQPHLMDFGLAKREAGEITMTVSGRILGTPAYMSPEQARGEAHQADARSDLYSLGVILFELLTGEKPFRGNSRMLLHQVLHDEAPSPRRLNGNVPRDLETICLKCLEKSPVHRYQSAREVEEELQRFLAGRPVLALPTTSIERGVRWCRRNPVVATLLATIATTLMIGLGTTLWQWRVAVLARGEEVQQRQRAENLAIESQRRLARFYVAEGNRSVELGDPFGALPWMNAAARLDLGDSQRSAIYHMRINSLLNRSPQLQDVLFHDSPVNHVAFNPKGDLIATATDEGTVRLWETETGRQHGSLMSHRRIVRSVQFTDDGTRLLTISGRPWTGPRPDQLHLWNVDSGNPVFEAIAITGTILIACVSRDGGRIATLEEYETFRDYFRWTVNLWDGQSGERIRELTSFEGGSARGHVSLSPDGTRVVAVLGNRLGVFDAQQGELLGDFISTESEVHLTGFNSAGTQFFTAQSQRADESRMAESVIRVWDTELASVGTPLRPRCEAASIRFAADDSELVVVGNNGKLWVGDIQSGRRRDESTHDGFVSSGQPIWISPDQLYLATLEGSRAGANAVQARGCRVWEMGKGTRLPYLLHHAGSITHAAFHPDADRLATCGDDKTVRLWDLGIEHPTIPPRIDLYPWASINWLRLSDDGSHVMVYYDKAGFQLFDVGSREPITDFQFLPDMHYRFGSGGWGLGQLVSPDCHSAYYVTHEGRLKRLDVLSGLSITVADQVDNPEGWPMLVHFSSDSMRVVVRSAEGEKIRWTVRDNTVAQDSHPVVLEYDRLVEKAVFSPRGPIVAMCGELIRGSESLEFLSTGTGKSLWVPVKVDQSDDRSTVSVAKFSPDGHRFVFGYEFANVDQSERIPGTTRWQLFDVEGQREIHATDEFQGKLACAEFSGDGRYLLTVVVLAGDSREGATSTGDWELCVWDAISGHRLFDPRRVAPDTIAVFNADGTQFAVGGDDGLAGIWDTKTGEPLTSAMQHSGAITQLEFGPDASLLVTDSWAASQRIELRVWEVANGDAVTPTIPLGESSGAIKWSPRAEKLIAASTGMWEGGCIKTIKLDDQPQFGIGNPEKLSQLLSLHTIDQRGAMVPVKRERVGYLWEPFSTRPAEFRSARGEDARITWHQQQLNAAVEMREWHAAWFHLNWLINRQPLNWKHFVNRSALRRKATYYYSTFERDPDWMRVRDDLDIAYQLDPDQPLVWRLRAEALSELNDWSGAADDYERLATRTGDPKSAWKHALARLSAGELDAYRHQCGEILSHDPIRGDVDQSLWPCLLREDAVEDHQRLLQLCEQEFERRDRNLTMRESARNYAAALLRAGRPDDAFDLLEQLESRWGAGARDDELSLLALVHARLGHPEDAKAWFARAESAGRGSVEFNVVQTLQREAFPEE